MESRIVCAKPKNLLSDFIIARPQHQIVESLGAKTSAVLKAPTK